MLHLTAFDAEDLSILSAQMQDAVIRFGDVSYSPRKKQFALVANRFAWDDLPKRTRRRSGLHIADVQSIKRQGPQLPDQDTVLALLAMTFLANPADADKLSGVLTMTFSGGHVFALTINCINVHLDDLGPAWSTETLPQHDAGKSPGRSDE